MCSVYCSLSADQGEKKPSVKPTASKGTPVAQCLRWFRGGFKDCRCGTKKREHSEDKPERYEYLTQLGLIDLPSSLKPKLFNIFSVQLTFIPTDELHTVAAKKVVSFGN